MRGVPLAVLALRKEGDGFFPQRNLAKLAEEKGDIGLAIGYEKENIKCEENAHIATSRVMLAHLYRRAGNTDEAKRLFSEEIQKGRSDFQPFEELYDILADQHDWHGAAKVALGGHDLAMQLMSTCSEASFRQRWGVVMRSPDGLSESWVAAGSGTIGDLRAKGWKNVTEEMRCKMLAVFASHAKSFIEKYERSIEGGEGGNTKGGYSGIAGGIPGT